MKEIWKTVPLDSLPLRSDLRGQAPYGAPQLEVPVQLNVNENPYPPSEKVVEDISKAVTIAVQNINRYPDREFLGLRADLASYLSEDTGTQLQAENIWAANGSNEVLQQLLQAFGGVGRTALSFAPTYPMYPEYSRNSLTQWVEGRRQGDFTLDIDHALDMISVHKPSVIFLTSPNNPTGTALTISEIESVLTAAPGIVIVDEAYAEFRRSGVPSAVSLLPRYPNLVVSRTMSKAFALAGARLGYLATSRSIVDALRIVRLPYHLSAVTQAVARAALFNRDDLMAKVDELRQERDRTVFWLRSINLEVADSDANFVLFGRFIDRHAVWQELLDEGVLIRESGPAGWLRVSIGTSEEMHAFKTALTVVLARTTR